VVGVSVGLSVGDTEGLAVGAKVVGLADGETVGETEGCAVGDTVAVHTCASWSTPPMVGSMVGSMVSLTDALRRRGDSLG